MTTLSQQLADHFAGFAFDKLPAASVTSVKALLLDYLGVALAGSQTGSGKAARAFAVEAAGAAQSSLIGDSVKVPPALAAFANAISSHSVELDDIDVLALFHFSPPVYSATLAAGQHAKADGKAVLTALAAGCEMMERLSRAANPSLRDRGYHTTPTCGVFGATIAAAKIYGLTPEKTVSALGLAGAQAGGLMEMYGPSMQKRFNPGPAARDGVTSVRMAELGFTGAATILEGERGFLKAFTDRSDPGQLVADLDKDYRLDIEFKPYSCARPIHNAIDCALEIRRKHAPDLDRIQSISMARHPSWAKYHQNPKPLTYHEAQVSLPWSVAVALSDGAALFDQYRNDRLTDPKLLRLAGMVEFVEDASLARGVSCKMTLTMDDGRSFVSLVDYPKGSIQNPMSPDELRGKFMSLATGVVGKEAAEKIAATVERLEDCPNVGELLALAQPQAQG